MATINTTQRQETRVFKFGNLEFAVRNPKGVFFMSDALKARIAGMSIADAKVANSAAWKERRQCERIMNRYHNASQYPGIWDSAAGSYGIAEAVCKETYKRMMRA